jgi:hypothetical protein
MDNVDNDGDGLIDEDVRGGFSATETQAIRGLVEEHEFTIALHMHTFKGTIYWPWMFTLQLPEDEDTFMRIAEGMNVFNGYDYRDMSDRNQQTFSRHPPVDGDSNDWMYGKHGILSYTIELGYNGFIPPEDELLGIVADNLGANLHAIEVADHPRKIPIILEHEALNDTTSTESREVTMRVSGGELVPEGMSLHYRTDDGPFQKIIMAVDANRGGYAAELPGVGMGQSVEYYFVANTVDQGTTFLPTYGPYEVFSYTVVEPEDASGSYVFLPILLILLIVIVVAFFYRKQTMSMAKKGYGRFVKRRPAA